MKKKSPQNRKDLQMNFAIVGKIADMIKEISSLSKTVVEAADSEKYAKSVESLNKEVDATYAQMRSVIVNSEKFSEEEKLERLEKLAEQEKESKRKCGEAIQGNRENVAKIALEVAKGLMTCGISFVPGIFKEVKQLGNKNKTLALQDSSAIVADLPNNIADVEE